MADQPTQQQQPVQVSIPRSWLPPVVVPAGLKQKQQHIESACISSMFQQLNYYCNQQQQQQYCEGSNFAHIQPHIMTYNHIKSNNKSQDIPTVDLSQFGFEDNLEIVEDQPKEWTHNLQGSPHKTNDFKSYQKTSARPDHQVYLNTVTSWWSYNSSSQQQN